MSKEPFDLRDICHIQLSWSVVHAETRKFVSYRLQRRIAVNHRNGFEAGNFRVYFLNIMEVLLFELSIHPAFNNPDKLKVSFIFPFPFLPRVVEDTS